MKRTVALLPCLLLAVAAWAGGIVSPRNGEVVPLVPKEYREFMAKPRAERMRLLADAAAREEMKRTFPEARPLGVRFVWTGGRGGTLMVRRSGGGPVFFRGTVTSNEQTLVNFEIAREYEWQVRTSEGEVLKATFRTEDLAPRMIDWPGIANARDLGGRRGLNGRRVKQGLVYRNTGLNDNAKWDGYGAEEIRTALSDGTLENLLAGAIGQEGEPIDVKRAVRSLRRKLEKGELTDEYCSIRYLKPGTARPGAMRMSEETRRWAVEWLGIRTELDLRTAREVAGMTGSPLGPTVKWVHQSAAQYDGLGTDGGRKAFRTCFRLFLDERNYPIDFHCIAGADRTGSLACILNGLLGVEEEELYRDWEITWPRKMNGSAARQNHRRLFNRLIDEVFGKYQGRTLNDRIAAYVISCGFTEDDLNAFRNIMLED